MTMVFEPFRRYVGGNVRRVKANRVLDSDPELRWYRDPMSSLAFFKDDFSLNETEEYNENPILSHHGNRL